MFLYDAETGVLRPKQNRHGVPAGTPMPTAPDPLGRGRRISVEGKPYSLAGICFALGHGRMAAHRIRFADGDRTNYRLSNLVESVPPRERQEDAARKRELVEEKRRATRTALGRLLLAYRDDHEDEDDDDDEPPPDLAHLLTWAAERCVP